MFPSFASVENVTFHYEQLLLETDFVAVLRDSFAGGFGCSAAYGKQGHFRCVLVTAPGVSAWGVITEGCYCCVLFSNERFPSLHSGITMELVLQHEILDFVPAVEFGFDFDGSDFDFDDFVDVAVQR